MFNFRKLIFTRPRTRISLSQMIQNKKITPDYISARSFTNGRKKDAFDTYHTHIGQVDEVSTQAGMNIHLGFNEILTDIMPSLESADCWVSHAWDKKKENIFVKNLSTYLKSCGHKMMSDQEEDQSVILNEFMDDFQLISPRKFIFVICTPLYIERLKDPESGVSREYKHIIKKWLNDHNANKRIFLLAATDGAFDAEIDADVTSKVATGMSEKDAKSEANKAAMGKIIPTEFVKNNCRYIHFSAKEDAFLHVIEVVKRLQAHLGQTDKMRINGLAFEFEDCKKKILSKYSAQFKPHSLYTLLPLDDNFLCKIRAGINIEMKLPSSKKEDGRTSSYQGLMPRYKYFYGRTNELASISECITKNRICFLKDNKNKKGGKTFIANEFAYTQLDKDFKYIYWIDGRSYDSARKDFLRILPSYDIADILKISNDTLFQDFLDAISSGGGKNEKILIIYDNVDDQNFLADKKILQSDERVHILIVADNEISLDKEFLCEIQDDQNWALNSALQKFPELEKNKLLETLVEYSEGYPLILYQLTDFLLYESERTGRKTSDLAQDLIDLLEKQISENGEIKKIENKLSLGSLDALTRLSLANIRVFSEYFKKQKVAKETKRLHKALSLAEPLLNFCSLIGKERIPKKLITNWLGQKNNITNEIIELLIKIRVIDVDRADNKNFFVIYKSTRNAIFYNLIYTGFPRQELYYAQGWINISMRVLLTNVDKIEDQELFFYHVGALIGKINEPHKYELNHIVGKEGIDLSVKAQLEIKLAEYLLKKNKEVYKKEAKEHIRSAIEASSAVCSQVHAFWKINQSGIEVSKGVEYTDESCKFKNKK